MIGFFSGTPRDGHGHHQVSGVAGARGVRPRRRHGEVSGEGLRPAVDAAEVLSQCASGPDSATLRVNTGEYDALLGRSYYEIAAESRSQHKSQGFGVLQRKGVIWGYLSREAARVGPEMREPSARCSTASIPRGRRSGRVMPAPRRGARLGAAAGGARSAPSIAPRIRRIVVPILAHALRQFRQPRAAAGVRIRQRGLIAVAPAPIVASAAVT
jgi:hypothetical protein